MALKRRALLTSAAGLTSVGAAGLGLALQPAEVRASTGSTAEPLPAQPPAAGPPYTALSFDGLCENPEVPGDVIAVPPGSRARFVENSSVLLAIAAVASVSGVGSAGVSAAVSDGPAASPPASASASASVPASASASATDRCAVPGRVPIVAGGKDSSGFCVPLDMPVRQVSQLPSVQAAHDWLADGWTPSPASRYADMGIRALLDLRLALRPDGALPAGPAGLWALVWPRDASWAAAAFSATGHHAEALSILRFLRRVQLPDGTWAARTLSDGSGRVPDARPPQLDALGWVPWAAWTWYTNAPAGRARAANLAALRPMIAAAADAAANCLQDNGLPPAASDYWEQEQPEITIGNAAALSCGLRAAAALGHAVGDPRASTWSAAQTRLAAATSAAFGPTGYRRTPAPGAAVDAAVTWLGPPLARPTAATARAVAQAETALRLANGGLSAGVPGPGAPGNAWTPEVAFFALHAAASATAFAPEQLTQPSDASRSARPGQVLQPTQLSDPSRSAQPGQLLQPAQLSEPLRSAQPGQLLQPTQPSDASRSAHPGRLLQPAQPNQPSPFAEPSQPIHPAQPGQSNWLAWLDRHRTPLGSLAEQVTPIGGPASMAPLAWTDAIVLLTLRALDRPLPIP
jgi:glucoamylase